MLIAANQPTLTFEVSYRDIKNYGNLGDKAAAGLASMHGMHKIHSESLIFFQSRSRIGICIGQAVSHSLHSEHLIGSRCIPRRLFFWVTAMIAPTGHT